MASCRLRWPRASPNAKHRCGTVKLVAYNARDAAGERLLDGSMLNAVLVLLLATAILGPILTERFAPGVLRRPARAVPVEGPSS
jgi:hypothetical protein